MILFFCFTVSWLVVSSFTTPTVLASAINQERPIDGNEGDSDDELHNDEEEDELLRMTDALTKIMV
jgi:hypothetical protein